MLLKGVSPAELARETGIGESTIFRYLSGEREPVYRKLTALATALDVRLDFLAGRESEGKDQTLGLLIDRFAEDLRIRLGLSTAKDASSGHTSQILPSEIPVIGKTSEGPSLRFSRHGFPCGPPVIGLPRLGDDDPHAYGVIFEGDSMTSRILDGDIVICSPSTQWRSGGLGLLRTVDGEIHIREISERGAYLVLRCYSPAYDLKEVDRSRVSFIHRAVSIRPSPQSTDSATEYHA